MFEGQEVKKNLTLDDIGIKAMGQKFANALWPPSIINSISKVNEQTINMVREPRAVWVSEQEPARQRAPVQPDAGGTRYRQ